VHRTVFCVLVRALPALTITCGSAVLLSCYRSLPATLRLSAAAAFSFSADIFLTPTATIFLHLLSPATSLFIFLCSRSFSCKLDVFFHGSFVCFHHVDFPAGSAIHEPRCSVVSVVFFDLHGVFVSTHLHFRLRSISAAFSFVRIVSIFCVFWFPASLFYRRTTTAACSDFHFVPVLVRSHSPVSRSCGLPGGAHRCASLFVCTLFVLRSFTVQFRWVVNNQYCLVSFWVHLDASSCVSWFCTAFSTLHRS